MKAPLAFDSWGTEEHRAIQRVLEDGRYTMGEKVKQFETAFAKYIGVDHAIMVNSGSSANLVAIAAWKMARQISDGTCIKVPALGWSTTYFPLIQNKLNIHVVDVGSSLNAPPETVDMAVSVLGNPYKGLPQIHDCCEAFGAELKGNKIGSQSPVSTFSFFFSHHIQTMEGGMICTNSEEISQICRSMRAHGWTRDLPDEHFFGTKSVDPLEESFKFVCPAYSVRPLEMEGAVGIEQLKKVDAQLKTRRENAEHYQNIFSDHPDLWIQKEDGNSSWFGFAFILYRRRRKAVTEALTKAGIECRPVVGGNILQQPVIKYLPHTADYTPIAEQVHEKGFMIGCHGKDILEEVDEIIRNTV